MLLLFDVKQHAEMKALYPVHVMQQIEDTIERVFQLVVPEWFAPEHVLAMQKYYDDDYVVILRHAGQDDSRLAERLTHVQQKLEAEIAARTSSFFDFPIAFHTAFSWIRQGEDAFEAVHHALQDARSIAKRHLPANIGHLRAALRQVLEEEQIRVLAQPIVSLDTGHITGWEVLTRGPENTPFAMPDQLFHYAYQTDLLVHLELLVVKKAFMVIRQQNTTRPVFLNVTVPSLKNPYFFQSLTKLLTQFPEIDPQQIVFEITERHPIDDLAAFSRSLGILRKAGFKLAVDDTGAGYASLHVISELLPDVIKIDRSIIHDIDRHEVKDAVLDAIMMVARKIGSHVVAEGIETEEEAKVLLSKKVDCAQGFFFSLPLEPFPEIKDNWVAKQKDGFAFGI
ncbi:EAL domain-containing protein [Brevibacillus sp. SYP-B805]|uniref:EAL domain-containing protein n=1 Tax=Brevibacillus sp. SYP-B805 TaxID=1578199 RepID=UPI0013ED0940|nr:EAL domain-containing protein [Brevibacillus sp. SYP-B805]NGQ96948.1 EAL domain-containing protein [Brevibacillus sp. SYP-B805]